LQLINIIIIIIKFIFNFYKCVVEAVSISVLDSSAQVTWRWEKFPSLNM
jgi:hypothetical protein